MSEPDHRILTRVIAEFLVARPGRQLCDDCILDLLGLPDRRTARAAAMALAITHSFARERGMCCECGGAKLTTRAEK